MGHIYIAMCRWHLSICSLLDLQLTHLYCYVFCSISSVFLAYLPQMSYYYKRTAQVLVMGKSELNYLFM